jgi:AraC-like DNA-binding protein
VRENCGVSLVTHVPPPALRPFVAVAHGYRVPAVSTGLHRGLPSRHLTLVVELLAPLRVTGPNGDLVAAHVVVGGLHTRPALIDASRGQEGLQYGLSALGVRALFGLPAAELCGLVVDAGDILGGRAARLTDTISAAASWRERFALLDAALLGSLDVAAGAPPDEVAEAWRVVFGTDGRLRVGDVAAHVGWGRRHLSEQFRLATGLGPKQAARIARFEAARRLLLAPGQRSLADIAVRCGYADQPHLAREWQVMAGCSIGTWLREEFPFVQDVPPVEAAASVP